MVNFFQLIAEDIDKENINAAYDAEKIPSMNGSGFQRSPPFATKVNGFVSTGNDVKSKPQSHKTDLETVNESLTAKEREDEINSEWRDLANILDRIFLVLYTLVTFIVTLVIMLQCAIQ